MMNSDLKFGLALGFYLGFVLATLTGLVLWVAL